MSQQERIARAVPGKSPSRADLAPTKSQPERSRGSVNAETARARFRARYSQIEGKMQSDAGQDTGPDTKSIPASANPGAAPARTQPSTSTEFHISRSCTSGEPIQSKSSTNQEAARAEPGPHRASQSPGPHQHQARAAPIQRQPKSAAVHSRRSTHIIHSQASMDAGPLQYIARDMGKSMASIPGSKSCQAKQTHVCSTKSARHQNRSCRIAERSQQQHKAKAAPAKHQQDDRTDHVQ
jgi:hypothetical protein